VHDFLIDLAPIVRDSLQRLWPGSPEPAIIGKPKSKAKVRAPQHQDRQLCSGRSARRGWSEDRRRQARLRTLAVLDLCGRRRPAAGRRGR